MYFLAGGSLKTSFKNVRWPFLVSFFPIEVLVMDPIDNSPCFLLINYRNT